MTKIGAFLLVLVTIGAVRAETSCTNYWRSDDLAMCLEGIRNAMDDVSLFWFGTSFGDRCSLTDTTVDCYNYRGVTDSSLSSILFSTGTYDGTSIDRYLNVEYSSPADSYVGCSYRHESTEEVEFTLDPLTADAYNAWEAREVPEVTWEADDTYTQYTVVILDVAMGVVHGLFYNIEDSNIEQAEAYTPYKGPLNYQTIETPYIFMLFKQQETDMAIQPYDALDDPTKIFDVNHFIDTQQLTGPIGVNWLLSRGDPYSVERYKQEFGYPENCSPFITEALTKQQIEFIDSTNLPPVLPTYVHIGISWTETSFTYCCTENEISSGSIVIDPIGNQSIPTVHARTGSQVTVNIEKNKLYPNVSGDFLNKHLTVLCVDPDVPVDKNVGNKQRPLLHWLATNFSVSKEGALMGGSDIKSYNGPKPPPGLPHYYYFLVLESTNPLVDVNLTQYSGECPSSLVDRCFFDVESFMDDAGLVVQGITWFRAENDDFIQFTRDVSQKDWCEGRPGYNDPCKSTSGAGYFGFCALMTYAVLLVTCILVY